MKSAKFLWILSSLLINVIIIIYIYLRSQAPAGELERMAHLQENWAIWSGHWKAEFIIMSLMAVAAFYFATQFRSLAWSVISVGMFIILLLYPIMLGGYKQTPPEIFRMANQMSIIVFTFGNVVFLGGLLLLYAQDQILPKWLRGLALLLAIISGGAFSLAFLDVIDWKQALITAPLVNVLYLINAYHGYRLPSS
ncbi:MAG: hypothetical protein AAFU64_09615 [Bacteroidota bacterium]